MECEEDFRKRRKLLMEKAAWTIEQDAPGTLARVWKFQHVRTKYLTLQTWHRFFILLWLTVW
eukprot:750391-Pelagomonas_calceolata.AAC.1